MKKLLFLLLLMMPLSLAAQTGESYLQPGRKHIIEVKQYQDYNIGYLTVTRNYVIGVDEGDGNSYSMMLSYFPVLDSTGSFKGTPYPEIGSAVLEVNGIDAKDMSEEKFYSIIKKQIDETNQFSMKLLRGNSDVIDQGVWEVKGGRVELLENWVPINDRYNWFPKFNTLTEYVTKEWGYGYTFADSGKEAYRLSGARNEEIHDVKYDFARIKTYDYLIVGGDPLNDTKILEKIPKPWNMVRDEEHPDILFAIAKNSQESVSSTYVPPSSRTENIGSVTTMHYSPLTKRSYFTTQQMNRTINEGGYTHSEVSSSFFLELSAIDVKKMDDPTIQYVPLIWKKTTTRNVINADFSPTDEMVGYASWAALPPVDRTVNTSRVCADVSGILNVRNEIISVIPGSRADSAGFKAGDIIVSAVAIRTYHKEDNSFFPYYFQGKYVEKKIKVKEVYTGFFDNASKVLREDDEWNGLTYDIRRHDNFQKDTEKSYLRFTHKGPWVHYGSEWGHFASGGDYNIWLDWEITIKRDGKKMILTLPGSRKGIVVSYSYLQ